MNLFNCATVCAFVFHFQLIFLNYVDIVSSAKAKTKIRKNFCYGTNQVKKKLEIIETYIENIKEDKSTVRSPAFVLQTFVNFVAYCDSGSIYKEARIKK